MADAALAADKRPVNKTLLDKTLVAWVRPANTTQRGGSLLTLIDRAERFDAVVFGEIAAGKWMAGSDFFRRTRRDQASCPVETADPETLVQVAVVYDDNQIRLYRNGKPYSTHKITRPQVFRHDAMVLIGLRYVGAMGEIGFFAGSIEEVRIYDVALSAEKIVSLKPEGRSDPRPLGCWTFQDGTAADRMGRFPAGRLCGGARIADGRLHLDGKTGYVICARPQPPFDKIVQTMFYRPNAKQTGRMWDTWLYFHEGTYHLYYLANSGSRWDNISMATSTDGVHWRERGRVLSKAEGVVWMGTGSTWRSPHHQKDGKFYLNFSEWRGPRQTIFFAESKDLLNWTRLGDQYEFQQDTRWYKPDGRWDCIYTIPRDGGGLFGYWTATPKEQRCRFGFGETLDGVTWRALPPPETPGVAAGEAGAVEKIGEKYYMMFGTGGLMVTLVADKPQGPFRPAKKNFRLLSGHTYFSRFFPSPQGVLVNHHAIARGGPVYFAPLKRATPDGQGTLRLTWWEGNEKLKHQPVQVKPPPDGPGGRDPIAMLPQTFDVDGGVLLEGSLAVPSSPDAKPGGLYIESAGEGGTAILVGAGGAAQLGPIHADGTGFTCQKRVDRQRAFAHRARFRLLLKHSLMEFYLDDVLIECYSLPQWASGRIGLIRGESGERITDLKAWR